MNGQTVELSYAPLVREVARALRRRCGVGEGDAVMVACSGGADSVALLRALARLASRRTWRLHLSVAHIQHHLRQDAEGDARFVADLAESLGLAFYRGDLQLHDEPGNVEANARRQRYAALQSLAQDANARFVATAHHGDDQLETVLMALLRGTTARGLRGIAWQRPLSSNVQLIRPMLGCTHDQATALLAQLDQPWREDATNTDRSRTRARLRHEVLPVLRDLRPSVARKVLEMSDSLRGLCPGPANAGNDDE